VLAFHGLASLDPELFRVPRSRFGSTTVVFLFSRATVSLPSTFLFYATVSLLAIVLDQLGAWPRTVSRQLRQFRASCAVISVFGAKVSLL
jgi:hypothetical protein